MGHAWTSLEQGEFMGKSFFILRRVFRIVSANKSSKKTWSLGFIIPAITGLIFYMRHSKKEDAVEQEANEYMPIQSDSERASGHPLVGSI